MPYEREACDERRGAEPLQPCSLGKTLNDDMAEYIRVGVLFTNSLQWKTWPALRNKLDGYFASENAYNVKYIVGGAKGVRRCLTCCPCLVEPLALLHASMSFHSNSPKRRIKDGYHSLAPASNTIQGPHQESMLHTNRRNFRHVVFACQETASEGGGTALFDMRMAWDLLPAGLKDELSTSFFKFPSAHTRAYGDKIPCAVKCDISGKACLQFYGFGRVSTECVHMYRARTGKQVDPDPYQYGVSMEEDLLIVNSQGEEKPFTGYALTTMLTCVYESMTVHQWTKGDVLIVDNVRWAHARLEGVGEQRKVLFTAYGPQDGSVFDINKFERPCVEAVLG